MFDGIIYSQWNVEGLSAEDAAEPVVFRKLSNGQGFIKFQE